MRIAAICALAFLTSGSARAAPRVVDPDWPCQSIKVPQLSFASFWAGPEIDPHAAIDPRVPDLARQLALRRMPVDEAAKRIADFAKSLGPNEKNLLGETAVQLFNILSSERDSVVEGLDRYGKRQKALAAGLRGEVESLREAQAANPPDDAKVADLTGRVTWDSQVFDQRRQALSFACDVPSKIEQRLFALTRVMQDQMQ